LGRGLGGIVGQNPPALAVAGAENSLCDLSLPQGVRKNCWLGVKVLWGGKGRSCLSLGEVEMRRGAGMAGKCAFAHLGEMHIWVKVR
jgi:hypothetical protein